MITIYTSEGEKLQEIPNDDFFKHITAMELLVIHPEFDEGLAYGIEDETSHWSFVKMSNNIRICTGDPDKTIYTPITRDIDVDIFKKYWYLSYCEAHGYSYVVTDYANGDIELRKM